MRPSKFSNFIFNRNVQGTFYQAITLSIVILGVYYIVQNTAENMMARGLASGFHFLGVESQFDIGMTLIEYSPTSTYFDAFIVGLLNTLLVAGIGIFFATIVGFAFGIMRLSSNWLIARIAETYIEVIRNIPLLLQIFFWYFAVLRALPKPKQSIEFMDSVFLNNRGLFLPDPNFGEGSSIIFSLFWITIVISCVHIQKRLSTLYFMPYQRRSFLMNYNGKSVLITGGTGSFGHAFTQHILKFPGNLEID